MMDEKTTLQMQQEEDDLHFFGEVQRVYRRGVIDVEEFTIGVDGGQHSWTVDRKGLLELKATIDLLLNEGGTHNEECK